SVGDGRSTSSLPPFSIEVGMPGQNFAPTISGEPPRQVAANTSYSFTPTAQDADGDELTFSVENAPEWASFDPVEGELAGMPTDAHVGTHEVIVIAVSDGVES